MAPYIVLPYLIFHCPKTIIKYMTYLLRRSLILTVSEGWKMCQSAPGSTALERCLVRMSQPWKNKKTWHNLCNETRNIVETLLTNTITRLYLLSLNAKTTWWHSNLLVFVRIANIFFVAFKLNIKRAVYITNQCNSNKSIKFHSFMKYGLHIFVWSQNNDHIKATWSHREVPKP